MVRKSSSKLCRRNAANPETKTQRKTCKCNISYVLNDDKISLTVAWEKANGASKFRRDKKGTAALPIRTTDWTGKSKHIQPEELMGLKAFCFSQHSQSISWNILPLAPIHFMTEHTCYRLAVPLIPFWSLPSKHPQWLILHLHFSRNRVSWFPPTSFHHRNTFHQQKNAKKPTTDFLWKATVIREVQRFRTVSKNQNCYLSVEPDNLSKDFLCSLNPGLSPKLLGHIQADQENINIKFTNDTCTDRVTGIPDFSACRHYHVIH